ncbi:MAG: hypothetical protein JO080_06045 [Mucilaginibacter sp.]|nr:hypothetical protein [Mucilaginibacter sp.]
MKKSTKTILRVVVETGFIMFLFYANLLMGEYDKTGNGERRSLLWVLGDIFTIKNFIIAVISATIGYFVFEFLRKKL